MDTIENADVRGQVHRITLEKADSFRKDSFGQNRPERGFNVPFVPARIQHPIPFREFPSGVHKRVREIHTHDLRTTTGHLVGGSTDSAPKIEPALRTAV